MLFVPPLFLSSELGCALCTHCDANCLRKWMERFSDRSILIYYLHYGCFSNKVVVIFLVEFSKKIFLGEATPVNCMKMYRFCEHQIFARTKKSKTAAHAAQVWESLLFMIMSSGRYFYLTVFIVCVYVYATMYSWECFIQTELLMKLQYIYPLRTILCSKQRVSVILHHKTV